MKKYIASFMFLSLFACRTPESPQGAASYALKAEISTSKDPIILEKIIGGLSAGEKAEGVFSCKLGTKDLKNLEQVQNSLRELAKAKMLTAMHFRATEPSVEFYGYLGSEKVLIYRDYSTLDFPAAAPSAQDPSGSERHKASENLEALLDELCPTPEAKSGM